jgi:hypothetical protein
MTNFDIHAAMAILRREIPRFEQPLIEAMGAPRQTPFHIRSRRWPPTQNSAEIGGGRDV